MNTLDVLKAARQKIMAGWCQGDFARDVHGNTVPSTSPRACCWCAEGALYVVASYPGACDARITARKLLEKLTGAGMLNMWNDSPLRTREEVINLFDRAIANEEKKNDSHFG